MQSNDNIILNALSAAVELLPKLRGALARESGVDGRPERVVLRLSGDNSEAGVGVASVEAAASAIMDGNDQVSIANLGSVQVVASGKGDLAGQVAVVTGGAGGLGYAVAQELVDQGASVALLDIAEGPVTKAAATLGAKGYVCNVTNPGEVDLTIAKVVADYGGVDILISNAGAAHPGALLELDDDYFERAFKLNFWSHHYVARAVVRVMLRQGTGGALVFNVSKQAVNPGPNFAAYGTPKAALMALMRQYAVEHGADGITSNAVNADRIRTGLMTDEMVEQRSKARGLTPDEYMRGNLVRREVTGKDVAEAFVFLAKARTSTGAVITVDGGNVAAMMR